MNAVSPLVSLIMSLFSVLIPGKMWYGPSQPIAFTVDSKAPMTLNLCHFNGALVEGNPVVDVPADGKIADLKALYPALVEPGLYVVFAVPKGKTVGDFVGTPIVIDARPGAGKHAPPGVAAYHLRPLQYVVMTTAAGTMTMEMYYDAAPKTVDSFLKLSGEGFYNGLTFHRILPGFVLQGGDPSGNGSGGPGYSVNAEFNAHQHVEGVLSMAREGDSGEQQGLPPGEEAANSAGSQFFVCLDYNQTRHLDRKYTAFGKVTDGLETMKKLAATPLADPNQGTPKVAPVIEKVEVFSVTPGHNPYVEMGLGK